MLSRRQDYSYDVAQHKTFYIWCKNHIVIILTDAYGYKMILDQWEWLFLHHNFNLHNQDDVVIAEVCITIQ